MVANSQKLSALFAFSLLYFFNFLAISVAHTFLDSPTCRGALNHGRSTQIIDSNAPDDEKVHFPAGDKDVTPGAGMRSQEIAGNFNWEPYNPDEPTFRWRAGVCGDMVNGNDHLKGGKYYWPADAARIVARYRSGDVIDARIKMVAHHNGYIEMRLCDVTKCRGGDISRSCFQEGHCILLRRAANPTCDGGMSQDCGPIDTAHPGRWYLPCSRNNDETVWETFGKGTMKFQIPSSFSCERCVLQMYWATANSCNPPGLPEYFEGPDRPRNWGSCPGTAGAEGGYKKRRRECGGADFAEEYYHCADISVEGQSADGTTGSESSLPTLPAPDNATPWFKVTESSDKSDAHRDIMGLNIVSEGKVLGRLYDGDIIYEPFVPKMDFEAIATGSAHRVRFVIDGGSRWERWVRYAYAPYFRMFSTDYPNYWEDVIVDRNIQIIVVTNGDVDRYNVKFCRNRC